MNVTTALLRAAFCVSLAAPSLLIAQQPSYLVAPDSPAGIGGSDSAPANSAVVRGASPAPAAKDAKSLTGRWLDLTNLSHSERFRDSYNWALFHSFEDGQQRSLVEGRLKLDKDAHYTVGFRASSGRFFNWAYADFAGPSRAAANRIAKTKGTNNWNKTPAEIAEGTAAKLADPDGNTISGSVDNGWEFYLRELYLSATPVKGATIQFGSFGFERGLASEATTYDIDGYLTGERILIETPKQLFFDQVGFTSAFIGFVNAPNLFDRGSGFQSSNYRQVFAKKQLNNRVGFSGEYTWLSSTNTLRQAAVIGTREVKFVDQVRFESYQRLNSVAFQGFTFTSGSGFAITADKKITDRLHGDAGFASIDKDYSVYGQHRYFHSSGLSLNGDTFGMGKRPFLHASYAVTPAITAFGYYTHVVGARVINQNQQGLNVGLTLDVKALANSRKKVF